MLKTWLSGWASGGEPPWRMHHDLAKVGHGARVSEKHVYSRILGMTQLAEFARVAQRFPHVMDLLTTMWSERTAQGFSPGNGRRQSPP